MLELRKLRELRDVNYVLIRELRGMRLRGCPRVGERSRAQPVVFKVSRLRPAGCCELLRVARTTIDLVKASVYTCL